MDTYLSEREKLIRQDRALRVDYASTRALSEDEQRADKTVRGIRTAEAATIWDAECADAEYGSRYMFPGMEFLTGAYT